MAALAGFTLIASLTLVAPPEALANHGNATLNVTPEYSEWTVGDIATLTATISIPAQETAVNIDFELEGGINDSDGITRQTPDRTCDIPKDEVSCSVTYSGSAANQTPASALDKWRVWIDHDRVQTTVEADPDEAVLGRNANQADCQEDSEQNPEAVDPFSGCPNDPTNNSRYSGGSGSPNAAVNCPGQAGATVGLEPDCTDVIEVRWLQTGAILSSLDCDEYSGNPLGNPARPVGNGTGPDSEREANVDGTTEVYRCRAFNQFAFGIFGGVNFQKVYAEVENVLNDPDAIDGASYASPDYTCEDPPPPGSGAETQNDVDDPNPANKQAGVCYIVIPQTEGDLGTSEVCFWAAGPNEDPGQTGTAHCANEGEPTGEQQQPDPGGTDSANDRADQVEVSWFDDSTFNLDCDPESDSGPVGTARSIVCTVREPVTQQTVNGVPVRFELSGAGDGDGSADPVLSDGSCTTSKDGTCTFAHTSGSVGETLYRAWIDDGDPEPDIDGTDEDTDRTEGRNENANPGEKSEPDTTDVVAKTWTPAPSSLTVTPETDTNAVGECNPYTILVRTGSGDDMAPVANAVIDIEQRHANADNNISNDEPTVSFCTPTTGANPSSIDTTKGDLGANSAQTNDKEDPDNVATAGGETTLGTDSNGQITIGILVTATAGSDGSGEVAISAFYDPNNNDDPDTNEPKDTATKTWVSAGSIDARTIDCTPKTATNPVDSSHTIICTVKNRGGGAVQGEGVTFTEMGPGTIEGSANATTDAEGQVTVTVTSNEQGTQTIIATINDDNTSEPDTDECDRAADDPATAPPGKCSDAVTKVWVAEGARTIDCEPETATTSTQESHTVTCTVRDDTGEPLEGRSVTFTEDGDGSIVSSSTTTNAQGQATVTVASDGGGSQTITGTLTESIQGEPDTDNCDRPANDPIGAPTGQCSDSVANTWVEPVCPGFESDTRNQIVGTEDDDDLTGSAGDDIICGLGGDDRIDGGGGNDLIIGGPGDDKLRGQAGNDEIFGEVGHDILEGGVGNDQLFGDGGRDQLRGGRGRDNYNGGVGNDQCDDRKKEKAKSC